MGIGGSGAGELVSLTTTREGDMAAKQMGYVIRHKHQSDKFFGGFETGPEFNVVWVDLDSAKQFSRDNANTQAILLRRFKNPVQIKPVRRTQ